MSRINVTKTFLPPKEEYEAYLTRIWKNEQLTNQGPLLTELEDKLKKKLKIDDIHYVTNGTVALQISLKALGIESGEIITTPFSYVATTSAILWEGCTPVFVDIEPDTFCVDADKIEAAITKKTKAILAVHVFGYPCNIEKIEQIAKKHNLKVIYDGAHAFGATYKGKSLLDYGDISTCSFHATKLFHTVEGGAIIAQDNEVSKSVELMKRFGHTGDNHQILGINAKASEFHAAMGLCNLKYIDKIIAKRKKIVELYDKILDQESRTDSIKNFSYNYAYYPYLCKDNNQRAEIIGRLQPADIHPRRYFFPSLNTLPYIENKKSCPVSEDIASRILCLPLYADLDHEKVKEIGGIISAFQI